MHLGGTKDSDKRRPHAGVAQPPGRGDVIGRRLRGYWRSDMRSEACEDQDGAQRGTKRVTGVYMYKLAFNGNPTFANF